MLLLFYEGEAPAAWLPEGATLAPIIAAGDEIKEGLNGDE
jgi:hypothetical protein